MKLTTFLIIIGAFVCGYICDSIVEFVRTIFKD